MLLYVQIDADGGYKMTEQFYTVKEVSELLKINERTVRSFIKSEHMRAYRVGKTWRIPYDALAEYLNENVNKKD